LGTRNGDLGLGMRVLLWGLRVGGSGLGKFNFSVPLLTFSFVQLLPVPFVLGPCLLVPFLPVPVLPVPVLPKNHIENITLIIILHVHFAVYEEYSAISQSQYQNQIRFEIIV